MLALTGRCHCGNLSVTLRTARGPEALGARACMCTFCRARRLRWSSDPEGEVELRAADDGDLGRYRFGTGTADFLFCRRCAQVIAAITSNDAIPRAVINVDLLDDADRFTDAGHRDFDGEGVDARRDRRSRHWTPARLIVGPSTTP